MPAYVMPEDGFDYCFSCNYLEEVVAVIWLEQSDFEEPLCRVCAKEAPCEYLPTMEGAK